jgi:hypothetical protein
MNGGDRKRAEVGDSRLRDHPGHMTSNGVRVVAARLISHLSSPPTCVITTVQSNPELAVKQAPRPLSKARSAPHAARSRLKTARSTATFGGRGGTEGPLLRSCLPTAAVPSAPTLAPQTLADPIQSNRCRDVPARRYLRIDEHPSHVEAARPVPPPPPPSLGRLQVSLSPSGSSLLLFSTSDSVLFSD